MGRNSRSTVRTNSAITKWESAFVLRCAITANTETPTGSQEAINPTTIDRSHGYSIRRHNTSHCSSSPLGYQQFHRKFQPHSSPHQQAITGLALPSSLPSKQTPNKSTRSASILPTERSNTNTRLQPTTYDDFAVVSSRMLTVGESAPFSSTFNLLLSSLSAPKSSSICSRLRPLVSGMKNQTPTPMMAQKLPKRKNMPWGSDCCQRHCTTEFCASTPVGKLTYPAVPMVRFISRTVRAMMKLKSHCVAAPRATLRALRRAVGISLFPLSDTQFNPSRTRTQQRT